MTNEETQHIQQCPILIVGEGEFISFIKTELSKLGFSNIELLSYESTISDRNKDGIMIEHVTVGQSYSHAKPDIPVIYAFDLVAGAAAIVVFPEDEDDFIRKADLRLWAAEYMAGYCAFWNVEGCDWLHDVVPLIKNNRTSSEAQQKAAYMCARIAANIATGRDVKRYPRFYVAKI